MWCTVVGEKRPQFECDMVMRRKYKLLLITSHSLSVDNHIRYSTEIAVVGQQIPTNQRLGYSGGSQPVGHDHTCGRRGFLLGSPKKKKPTNFCQQMYNFLLPK